MSFFYGLVEGLATSANEALQNDIKRINTRVDSIAERQLEKALKQQEERAEEVAEVEEALKEGYALFGGDADPSKAKQYAAGLLKEMGSLDAYRQRIAELRKSKDDQGQDLGQFFTRASEDAPTGSFNDYANAFLGAPKTFAGDYRVPEGMRGERPAGGLVSKVVGKPVDVVQMGLTRAKEDITAAIGDISETKLVSLPSITFKAEEFKLSGMKAGERLSYINDQLAKPGNTEDRNNTLNDMLQKALNAAEASGDMTTKLDATKQMISRETDPEKLKTLFDNASKLSYDIDMAEAKATGSKIGMLDAEIKRQQYLNNTDKVKELVEQKNVLSGEEKTQSQITKEMEEELIESVNNGLDTNSEEYKTAKKKIDNRKENERLIKGVADSTPAELNSARSYFDSIENDIIARLLGGSDGKTFIQIANGINSKILKIEELPAATLDIYTKGLARQKEARAEAIKRLRPYADKNPAMAQHIKHITNEIPRIDEIESLSDTDTSPATVTEQTTQAIPTEPEQPVTNVEEEEVEIKFDALREIVKEDITGATEIVKSSDSPQDAYETAIGLYPENKQFATTVEFIASKDDTGLDGLEKEIAEMALQGLNANQITQQLKQVKYAGDTSMDVASISSTVARVLSEIKPESRQKRIESQQRASEARAEQLRIASQPPPSLTLPSGLMSRQ